MGSSYQIGSWYVASDRNSLESGEHRVRLEPKAMEVLLCLIEAQGAVVTREQLLRRVWNDAFVTDDVLKRCIWNLRKALGDDSKRPKFIETIPKGGYRLLLPAYLVNGESATVRPVAIKPSRPTQRRFGPLGYVSAILVICVIAGVYQMRGRKPPTPESIPAANLSETTERLVKGAGPKVFFVVGGRRRWIPDGRTMDVLGLDWAAVLTIPDKQLDSIPQGEDYPALTGRVVKADGPELYLLGAGKRQLILDSGMLGMRGLEQDDIQIISDQALRLIPSAGAVSLATSALSLAKDAKGTYLDSCRDRITRGKILTAVCQKLDGSWQTATLDGFDRCVGDIWNVDGYLDCDLQHNSLLPDPDLDPTGFYTHLTQAEELERKGAYKLAIAEYRHAMDVADQVKRSCGRMWLAHAYARSGDRAIARTVINAEVERSSQSPPSYCRAQAYADLDNDEAIRWLDRAHKEQDPRMRFLATDWRLASLHSNARFRELVRLSSPRQ